MPKHRHTNNSSLTQSFSLDGGMINVKKLSHRTRVDERNLRRVLRALYPDHPPHDPWRFTEKEARELCRRLARRRPVSGDGGGEP
jgi:hypothetical protein